MYVELVGAVDAEKKLRKASVRVDVNGQGHLFSTAILQSSGSSRIDRALLYRVGSCAATYSHLNWNKQLAGLRIDYQSQVPTGVVDLRLLRSF